MKKFQLITTLVAGVVSLATALPITITGADFEDDANVAGVAGVWEAKAGPSGVSFGVRELTGYGGFSVGTDAGVPGEIDGTNWIQFTFAEPVRIDQITLAHLYPKGEYGDIVNETALIFENSNLIPYSLTATGPTTATWTGSGTVTNLSVAQDGNPGPYGYGIWQIENPFGDQEISSLRFRAKKGKNIDGPYSDFSIYSLTLSSVSVPEPGTLSLLGIGLFALAFARKRKKA